MAVYLGWRDGRGVKALRGALRVAVAQGELRCFILAPAVTSLLVSSTVVTRQPDPQCHSFVQCCGKSGNLGVPQVSPVPVGERSPLRVCAPATPVPAPRPEKPTLPIAQSFGEAERASGSGAEAGRAPWDMRTAGDRACGGRGEGGPSAQTADPFPGLCPAPFHPQPPHVTAWTQSTRTFPPLLSGSGPLAGGQ